MLPDRGGWHDEPVVITIRLDAFDPPAGRVSLADGPELALRGLAGTAPGADAAGGVSSWRSDAANGVGGELHAVGVAELLEHVLQVGGDGASRHEEALGDLGVGQSFGHEVDHAEPRWG